MEEIKKTLSERPVKIGDLFVYILLIAIVALCFLLSAFSVERGDSFDVYSHGEIVLQYSFEDGSYRISGSAVEKIDEDKFIIRCDRGYNVLTVDREKKDVVVTDADCVGKECTLMKLSNGSIICAPHSLIVKYSGEELSPKVG